MLDASKLTGEYGLYTCIDYKECHICKGNICVDVNFFGRHKEKDSIDIAICLECVRIHRLNRKNEPVFKMR